MKFKTILNGNSTIMVGRTAYKILSPLSIQKSDDGFYRYIYYIFDHKNSKYYIGQHRTMDIVNDEYQGSGSKILEAYEEAKTELKDDWEQRFTKCIIAEARSEEELNHLEAKIVNKHILKDYNSYNAILGGRNGYKACNAISIYVYDLNGNLIESFPSISKAASWGIQHVNTSSSIGNFVSLIASAIKKEKYKSHGYYWVDYEIKDWSLFLANMKTKKGVCRNKKNGPVVIIDGKSGEKTVFKNRMNLAKWLIDNGYSNTESTKQVTKTIMRAINENSAAYGFIIQNAKINRSNDIKTTKYVFEANNEIQETVSFLNAMKAFLLFCAENGKRNAERCSFTIELNERLYTLLLGTVLLFNTENGIKSDFDNMSSEFEFQDFRFRKCSDENMTSRIIVDNILSH